MRGVGKIMYLPYCEQKDNLIKTKLWTRIKKRIKHEIVIADMAMSECLWANSPKAKRFERKVMMFSGAWILLLVIIQISIWQGW